MTVEDKDGECPVQFPFGVRLKFLCDAEGAIVFIYEDYFFHLLTVKDRRYQLARL